MKVFTPLILTFLFAVVCSYEESEFEFEAFELSESPEPYSNSVFGDRRTIYGTIGVGIGALFVLIIVSQCCCKRARVSPTGYDRV